MTAGPAYTIIRDAPLRELNSLRVAARVDQLIEVHDSRALPEIFALPAVRNDKAHVLGEGSNILVTGDISGSLLRLKGRNVQTLMLNEDTARLRVEAGHGWHELVMHSLEMGLAGLENLALIPGTVGAAPIQNIGAYGIEVGDFIVAVEVHDRQQEAFRTLARAQCGFGYRDSLFKRDPDRFVVTAVTFELDRHDKLRLDYQGIREELEVMAIEQPTSRDVAAAVIRLRQRKLPDPLKLPNAGSFFKNPIVDEGTWTRLQAEFPGIVHWPVDHGHKLSAGWLIEHAGLKGARTGDAGIAANHALVLVNHGQATGPELRAFAEFVQSRVEAKFGVRLVPEPVYW